MTRITGPALSDLRLYLLKASWCRHFVMHTRGRMLAAMRRAHDTYGRD